MILGPFRFPRYSPRVNCIENGPLPTLQKGRNFYKIGAFDFRLYFVRFKLQLSKTEHPCNGFWDHEVRKCSAPNPPATVGNIGSFHRLRLCFFPTLPRLCLPILPLLGTSFVVSRCCSPFTQCSRYLLSNPCREPCGGH